jgi:hypothetical protein
MLHSVRRYGQLLTHKFSEAIANSYSPTTAYAPLASCNDRLCSANFSLEGLQGQKSPAKRLRKAAPIHRPRLFKKAKIEERQKADKSSV